MQMTYFESILIARVFNNQPDELFYLEFLESDYNKIIDKVKSIF